MVTPLAGRKILIVEDEVLVAAMVSDMLEDAGASVVGPASSIAEGMELAASAPVDAAMLDVNLRGHRIDPVAETLEARGVPFIFASGYGSAPDERWAAVPMIDKPYSADLLIQALRRILPPT